MGKIDRTGEEKVMNNGLKAEIIAYRKNNDIDVKFEDGYIAYNKSYQSFKNGYIKNPNILSNLKYKYRIGETSISSEGLKMEIIEYKDSDNITIKFEDGTIVKNIQYGNFKRGNVKNPFNPSLCNVGYIGYTKIVDQNGRILKSYECWRCMIMRCYDVSFQRKHPTYKDCKVCQEWLCYANFKEWYNEHHYELEDEKVHLDKDILIDGNKIYSPETCIFVPQTINNLFCKRSNKDLLPFGIRIKNKKYEAGISVNGEYIYLGSFNSMEEAEECYNKERIKKLKDIADKYKDKIPNILYDRLYNYK